MPDPSPPWFPIVIIALLAVGTVIVMAGYWGIPSGGEQLGVIAFGAVLFLVGVLMATRYR